MKASDLICRLTELAAEHGDLEVFMDVGPDGVIAIGEVDVDAEDTGIMLWPVDGEG